MLSRLGIGAQKGANRARCVRRYGTTPPNPVQGQGVEQAVQAVKNNKSFATFPLAVLTGGVALAATAVIAKGDNKDNKDTTTVLDKQGPAQQPTVKTDNTDRTGSSPRAAGAAGGPMTPSSAGSSIGRDSASGSLLPPTRSSEQGKRDVQGTNTIASKTAQAISGTTDKLSEGYEAAKDKIADTYESAKEKMTGASNKAGDKSSDTKESGRAATEGLKVEYEKKRDQVVGKAYDLKDKAEKALGQQSTDKSKGMKDTAKDMKESAKDAAKNVQQSAGSLIDSAKDTANDTMEGAKVEYEKRRDQAVGKYYDAKDKAEKAWDEATGKGEDVKERIGRDYQAAKNKAEGMYENVKDEAEDMYRGAKNQADRKWEEGKREMRRDYEYGKDRAEDMYERAKDRTEDMYSGARNQAGRKWEEGKREMRRDYEYGKDKGEDMYDDLKNKTARTYDTAKEKAEQGLEYVKDKAEDAYEGVKGWMQEDRDYDRRSDRYRDDRYGYSRDDGRRYRDERYARGIPSTTDRFSQEMEDTFAYEDPRERFVDRDARRAYDRDYSRMKEEGRRYMEEGKDKMRRGYEYGKDKAEDIYEDARRGMGRRYDEDRDRLRRDYEYGKDRAEDMYEHAKDKAGRTWEEGKRRVRRDADYGRDRAEDMYEKGKEKAGQMWEQGKEKMRDKAEDAYEYGKDRAKGVAGRAWDKTKDTMEDTYEGAVDMAKRGASAAVGAAADASREARGRTMYALSELTDRFGQEMEDTFAYEDPREHFIDTPTARAGDIDRSTTRGYGRGYGRASDYYGADYTHDFRRDSGRDRDYRSRDRDYYTGDKYGREYRDRGYGRDESTMDKVKGMAGSVAEGAKDTMSSAWESITGRGGEYEGHEMAEGSGSKTPGDMRNAKTFVGESISAVMQRKTPLNAHHTYWTSIPCKCGDVHDQKIGHHYVAHVNEDVMQSVIYDSNKSDAKLIGVEYIITEKLFNNLPDDEKKLWHSHAYETMSGALVAPMLPKPVEKKLMQDLAPTYGKTFTFWDSEKDPLPYGIPQLFVAPTKDGDLNPDVIKKRDQLLGVDIVEEAKSRKDLKLPQKLKGADAWEKGEAYQLSLQQVNAANKKHWWNK